MISKTTETTRGNEELQTLTVAATPESGQFISGIKGLRLVLLNRIVFLMGWLTI